MTQLRRLGTRLSLNGQNPKFTAAQIHRIITVDDFPRQELAVMRLVAIGLSTKEVADHLGLSIKTVVCYRDRIHKRLGIHDVVRLVHCAIKLGVIPCPLHGAQKPTQEQNSQQNHQRCH